MKIKNFFNNLHVFFSDEDELSTEITGTVHKDENGKIIEIRFYNPDYDEFLVIEREGHVDAVNVLEFEEDSLTQRKKAKRK
jgi:hypothetical protein